MNETLLYIECNLLRHAREMICYTSVDQNIPVINLCDVLTTKPGEFTYAFLKLNKKKKKRKMELSVYRISRKTLITFCIKRKRKTSVYEDITDLLLIIL